MPYDLKQVADQLNNLSEGIHKAVEKQMQSERFKAELITNVSHDLKTPLTSIINYIDLLKQTHIDDPKALEYLEVLDRKSQRLKKLTEDLVEASKASTGTLKVEKTSLDFGQLVAQALGEYDEKLRSAKLTPVYHQPENPLMVLADGRHLWRVLDNLLNNCVKYAMPGTRVYLSLRQGTSFVTLEMKNISSEPLNLTAEELMERFVRGDSSRTTEGSGLGLNIAQNLVSLQGGHFALSVDGDLFKAIVTIPVAPKQEPTE
jgi:signal transduction histidine kinase